jgi:hypothetical protein
LGAHNHEDLCKLPVLNSCSIG